MNSGNQGKSVVVRRGKVRHVANHARAHFGSLARPRYLFPPEFCQVAGAQYPRQRRVRPDATHRTHRIPGEVGHVHGQPQVAALL